MKRNLKTLGVACLAALALSAVAASAASAQNTFSSEAGQTYLMGSGGTQVFDTEVDTLDCESVEIDTINTPPIEGESVEEVTLVPIYSACEIMDLTAHIEFTECAYIFSAGPTTGEGDAPLHIECPDEQEIHIKVTFFGSKFPCITVPKQTIETGAHYENSQIGEDNAITVDITATGITFKPSGICGLPEPETHNGKYNGKVTVTGTEEPHGPTVNIFHTEE